MKKVESIIVEGRKSRGRPRRIWIEQIKVILHKLNLSADLTRDRSSWRRHIHILITDDLLVYLLVSLTFCFYRFLSISSLSSFCSGSSFIFIGLKVIFHVLLRLFIFLERGDSFGRALLYGYELSPSFPFQTLALVFYDRNILCRMMMMIYLVYIIDIMIDLIN